VTIKQVLERLDAQDKIIEELKAAIEEQGKVCTIYILCISDQSGSQREVMHDTSPGGW